MENKNVVLLKHHPMNLKYTNTFYTDQVDDDLSEYVVVDVTSRVLRNKEFMMLHPKFALELSPFFIGPVTSSDGVVANVFEHFWQCGKVYPCHYKDGKLTPEFFNWRKEWYAKEKTIDKGKTRHPNEELGYKPSECIGNAYYENGEYRLLDYIESRKKIYFVEYAKLIYNTDSFKYLKSIVDSGKKLALVDFDGFNFYSEKAMRKRYESYLNSCKKNGYKPTLKGSNFTSIKTMKDVINCSFLAVGHGFVIKALLDGSIEVIGGELIDHDGLLE